MWNDDKIVIKWRLKYQTIEERRRVRRRVRVVFKKRYLSVIIENKDQQDRQAKLDRCRTRKLNRYIVAVRTKRQNLSFFQKRFWKWPLKTTNISRYSSRKSKNLAFCFNLNNRYTCRPPGLSWWESFSWPAARTTGWRQRRSGGRRSPSLWSSLSYLKRKKKWEAE